MNNPEPFALPCGSISEAEQSRHDETRHFETASAVDKSPHQEFEPLDSSGNFSTRATSAQTEKVLRTGRTRSRYLRKMFRQLSQRKGERMCGIALTGGSAQIVASTSSPRSRLFGVHFCKSAACPGCSHHRNVELVNKLVPALEGATHEGHTIFFFTLTLRHSKSTDPSVLLKGFSKCWNATNTRLKRHLESEYEFFWSRDYTWSPHNGHHFHLHGILVVKEKMTVRHVAQLQNVLFDSWNDAAIRNNFGECARDAFYCELVNAGTAQPAVARYITKLTKTAFEAVGGDWKRGDGSLSQFQLLEELYKCPEQSSWFKTLKKAYREQRKATFGRRTYSCSKKFWAMKELRRLVDPRDEDAEADPVVPDPIDVLDAELKEPMREYEWKLFTILPKLWRAMVSSGDTENVQTLLEEGACGQWQSAADCLAYQELIGLMGAIEHNHHQNLRTRKNWLTQEQVNDAWEGFSSRHFSVRWADPQAQAYA